MPIIAIILPALRSIGAGLWRFAASPFGRLVIVGAIGFAWGDHRAGVLCEQREAARAALQRQADDAEKARQRSAAVLIEAQDRAREAMIEKNAAAAQSLLQKFETPYANKALLIPGPTVFACNLRDGLTAGVRDLAAAQRRRAPQHAGPRRILPARRGAGTAAP